jgi:hypothetical protein
MITQYKVAIFRVILHVSERKAIWWLRCELTTADER